MNKRERPLPEREENEEPLFHLKEYVTVAERKHPGFNKEGGAGKITKINYEGGPESKDLPLLKDGSEGGLRTTNYTYNVKYVLGGSEKRIDAQWIESKDPLKIQRAELSAKRAKLTQERKEAKEALEKQKEMEMQRLLEEKRKKRAAARESSLAMVKKIREQLKAKKEKEAKQKKVKKDQMKTVKNASISNSKSFEPHRSPLLPTHTNVSLTPVKIDFGTSKSQQESKDSSNHLSTNKATSPVNIQNVKILMAALARIENKFRTGEVELEQLKDDLAQNGYDQLANDTAIIENSLKHLQEENRVMYREEVIWII